jgi:Arc/MetJ-type ribon-helix-helix transcriptional regulator
MQVNLPPDLETLVNKRLSSGGYENVEDVFRRALEAQAAEESWTEEERRIFSAHTALNLVVVTSDVVRSLGSVGHFQG